MVYRAQYSDPSEYLRICSDLLIIHKHLEAQSPTLLHRYSQDSIFSDAEHRAFRTGNTQTMEPHQETELRAAISSRPDKLA